MRGKISGMFKEKDKRGRHSPHNKTPKETIQCVRKHIESFPVVDPHYTRKDTSRQFLCSDLNISKMYSLYKEQCQSLKTKCVSHAKYRNIFNSEYNLSFHVPKKDQCQTCNAYQQASEAGSISDQYQEIFDNHIQRKVRARAEKELDKQFAKEKECYHTATFDMEAVLQVPYSLVSQVYYKRKLCCYNLSVYSLKDGNASCFLWNETEGKRGSCEIATCVQLYLKSLSSQISHVCLYSDSCGGQNRNRFMSIALLHAVGTIPNISVVDQKFLETGHSQMECDSIHSAVERPKKSTSVFLPSHWDTVIRMARRKKPYTVIPLKFSDFLNFKPITQLFLPSNPVDTKWGKGSMVENKMVPVQETRYDINLFQIRL